MEFEALAARGGDCPRALEGRCTDLPALSALISFAAFHPGVAQAGLELPAILLPLPPDCQDYRQAPLNQACFPAFGVPFPHL